ncbi:MAG: dTDP-4-dehydrorhamnose reductase [Actinomycetota bacterium]
MAVKVAVTGAGGGLGRALLRAAADHEVRGFTRGDLDVRSLGDVRDAIERLKPDVVVHCAAMTKVDACEEDPQRAAETNVLGSFNVAVAARRAGALLVAISTDYVFGGEQEEPYDERALPNPLSVYARTKYAGEAVALAVSEDALVVRTAWVFGAGDDFFSKAVTTLAGGGEVGGIADQIGSPTFVDHLAERLLPLADSGIRGVVHLSGVEPVTWYEALVRAKRLGDLSGEVVAKKAGELDRPAPRPANSALTSVVLPGSGIPPMPPLDEGLREVIRRVGG